MSVVADVRERDLQAVVINAIERDLRSVSTELKQVAAEGPILIKNAAQLHGLMAGFKSGDVTIEGEGGDYLGVLNDGATIRVTGNAGRYLADNMTGGTMIVEGDAGYGAGQYCYGGTLVIHGNAGDFSAVMNKGATIIVEGDVGDEVATYMLAGDLIVVGNAGRNLGNYLIRGCIYIAGTWKSLGHNTNTLQEELAHDDLAKLHDYFDRYGVDADPAAFTKIVRLSEKPFYKAKEAARPEQVPLAVPQS
jgi:glutamate synthase domain-containing protein 3